MEGYLMPSLSGGTLLKAVTDYTNECGIKITAEVLDRAVELVAHEARKGTPIDSCRTLLDKAQATANGEITLNHLNATFTRLYGLNEADVAGWSHYEKIRASILAELEERIGPIAH